MTAQKKLRLLLVRHGEAQEPVNGNDISRPLTMQGTRDVKALGRFLSTQSIRPDLIFCSNAHRTKQTAEFLIEGAGLNARILHPNAELYISNIVTLLNIIKGVEPGVQTLLIVGHEPYIKALALLCVNLGRKSEYTPPKEINDYPTAGLCVIEYDGTNWADFKLKECHITGLYSPSDYNSPLPPQTDHPAVNSP